MLNFKRVKSTCFKSSCFRSCLKLTKKDVFFKKKTFYLLTTVFLLALGAWWVLISVIARNLLASDDFCSLAAQTNILFSFGRVKPVKRMCFVHFCPACVIPLIKFHEIITVDRSLVLHSCVSVTFVNDLTLTNRNKYTLIF